MNQTISSLFWIHFWQITLLIPAAVVAVRYLLHRFPHLAYGILLLVLLKTIFPPIWDFPTAIGWEMIPLTASPDETESTPVSVSDLSHQDRIIQTSSEPALSPQVEPELKPSETASPHAVGVSSEAVHQQSWQFSQFHVVIGIWLAGVLALLGYIFGKRAQLLRFHRDTQVPASDELLETVELVSAELGLIHLPRLLVTMHPTVPFASGYFQQIVVLPAHLVEQSSREELKLVLAHEMTHLRRGDTLVGLLQLFVQVIWWFHPLVYWLNREVRRVREECCDTDVVTQLNCQPVLYARCLLNMLELQQNLRPSTELVGLSPMEVTTKRMQNIMRTSQSQTPQRLRFFTPILLLIFAICVLPTSASSFNSPKVIVGELAPADAQRVSTVKEPPPEADAPTKKKQRPKRPHKSTAETPPDAGDSKITDSPPPAESAVVTSKYLWKRGDTHRYRVSLEARYPARIYHHQGSPEFKVAAYAAGIPALQLGNETFKREMTQREGVTVPTLPDFDDSETLFAPVPSFALSPFGYSRPDGPSANVEGSNSHIDPATGTLPYLLGPLQDWVFPEIPETGERNLHKEIGRDLRLTGESNVSRSPFSSPSHMNLSGHITLDTSLIAETENQVTFRRTWHLKTAEQIAREPLREVSLSGDFVVDRDHSFPVQATFFGQLVEREANKEVRIPLSLKIERLP